MFNPLKSFIGSWVGRIVAGLVIAAFATMWIHHFIRMGEVKGQLDLATKEWTKREAWVREICSVAGVLPQEGEDPSTHRDRCQRELVSMIGFYTRANSETNKALVAAETTRVQRLEVDYAAKLRNEKALQQEVKRLKEISANVKDGVVGPGYWAALNRVAGLLPPGNPTPTAGEDPGDRGHINAEDSAAGTAVVPREADGVPGN